MLLFATEDTHCIQILFVPLPSANIKIEKPFYLNAQVVCDATHIITNVALSITVSSGKATSNRS